MVIKRLLLLIALTVSLTSCKAQNKIPEALKDVKFIVSQLDSAVTAMYGWEPQDSTYDKSVDTLVVDIIDKINKKSHNEGSVGPTIKQETYDSANVTWTEFKSLIDADQYEKALELYLADKEDGQGKNSGDILLFLKHSSYRYLFDSDVLFPLMNMYKGEAFATEHYINVLKLEKCLEEASITMSQDEEQYIPQIYPFVVRDLGYFLAATGRMDEALELSGDLISAFHKLTGSAIYANFYGTQYTAQLCLTDNDPETALYLWENLEKYIDEHRDEYSSEELEEITEQIQVEKKNITANHKSGQSYDNQ